jgi:hypothetical protein
MPVSDYVGEVLDTTGRPTDRQTIDAPVIPQAEMDLVRHLRAKTIMRIQLAHKLPTSHGGRQSRTNSLPIAPAAAERDRQVMFRREAILEEQQAAAAGLTNDQVELAIVAKVSGNHRTAVAVTIRPRKIADVHEILATDVQEDSVPFKAAQIVAMAKDLPGTIHPKLPEGGIERTRLRNARPALPRL